MQEFLNNPAVQGGVAPFVVALVVVALLNRVRLGGLAILAGFAVAVHLIAGFDFASLNIERRIILVGLLAPLAGVVLDLLKSSRTILLALACGALAVWVFWPVLHQKELTQALLLGGGAAAFVAWMTGFALVLRDQPIRAGVAGLWMGLGVGVAAILGASAKFGLYGIALGASAGAFLLLQMLTGRRFAAGATFALPVAFTAALLAAGTMILAELPWYALLPLALIPLAVRLPASDGMSVWLQAILLSLYACIPAIAAFFVIWQPALS